MAPHLPHPHVAHSDGSEDLLLSLGRLVDVALSQLELQRVRVELAAALQRHMLPCALPDQAPVGLRFAARYVPSQDGLNVGGDWYDIFSLPDGSLVFAIGDVQGHDMDAIALMGQFRVGLRSAAEATTDPGEVLAHTNELLLAMDCSRFATCSFLRFDPFTGELSASRAGHLPVAWADADGRSGAAFDECGPPLGVVADARYPVTRRWLAEEGVLLLVTDGVVEGPCFPIEQGMKRVLELVRAGCRGDPDVLADQVLQVADLTGHRDDAALLVIHHARLAAAG
ncbi:PP2C family protein-serine/threonine phosphatase [Streptomyces sp. NPDC004069]|uniref:PP2C family protein-serine/threonine phosphatase n=1 Tax=Streptomyces sp. NPDC052043 TaxID=3365684 RepID=UPI0037CD374C